MKLNLNLKTKDIMEYVAAEHDINSLIKSFIEPDNIILPEEKILNRRSGAWQGQESYKDFDMLVKRDVTLNIPIPPDPSILASMTKADQPWSEAHFQERIGGYPLNPGESYKIWPYADFNRNTEFQKDLKFDHSYMERFWPKEGGDKPSTGYPQMGLRFELGDYNDLVQHLIENPLTRQAYLPIFFPEDTGAKNNMRVPCTLGYLFEIWDNKLDITYYIRSCDAFRHLRNDIYLAGRLLQHTSNLLFLNNIEVIPGRLNMKIANLHIFKNDTYALRRKENKLCE